LRVEEVSEQEVNIKTSDTEGTEETEETENPFSISFFGCSPWYSVHSVDSVSDSSQPLSRQ
jgi:hypothetical protein